MHRILTLTTVSLLGVLLHAQTPPAAPVYNTIPSPLPSSLISEGFGAEFTAELGNRISFVGTDRRLTTVNVVLVTWAYRSLYPSFAGPDGWSWPITLNIYSVDNSVNPPKPGTLLGTLTQSFHIPWRAEPDPMNCPGTLWLSPDGCRNGFTVPITFDFSRQNLTLPDQIIFGVAYNTQAAGYQPVGTSGPYDLLNLGEYQCAPTDSCLGTNLSYPTAYLNSSVGDAYGDRGAGGVNVFRYDTGGNHLPVAIQFNAFTPPPASITVNGSVTYNATVGTQFPTPLQAIVRDAVNIPLGGVAVTFSAPASGPSAGLAPASGITDSNGLVSVTATANTMAGSYAVTASVTGTSLAPATFTLTNLAGQAQTIAFMQQPSGAQAGQPISPDVTVSLRDAYMNPITGTQITLMAQGAGGLNGYAPQNTVNGVATFHGLSINAAGPYTLLATASGGPSIVSSAFTISPNTASAAISVYDGDTQTATVNTAYGKMLQAQVLDSYGNAFVGTAVTFTAPASGASVSFSNSTTVNTDNSGIAAAPMMIANSEAGSFHVTAAASSLTSSTASFTLTNAAGTANKLTFVQQPTDTVAGQDISPVTVQLLDSVGNPSPTAGVPVTVQANAVLAQKGLFSGNATVNTDSTGLATFSDLSIARAGTYQLLASSSGVTSATSNPFNVNAGASSSITATGGTPQSALVLTVFPSPLQVSVADASGNPVSGVPVSFAAPSSGPGGTFGGQGTVTVNTDAQGHAQAVIMANNIAGSYVVTAVSTMVSGSASFSLTNLPPATTSLKFVQQPSNTLAGQAIAPPVMVQVQNSSGAASNTPGLPVLLSLSSGTGALLGTILQVTDSTGTATFNDLRIAGAGTKQITATSQSQISAVSNTFQILAGAAATVTAGSGTPQSTTVSTEFPMVLQARVVDLAGNPVSGTPVTFVAPATGPSVTFTDSASTTTDINGNAFSPMLRANSTPGSFIVTATVTGTSSAALFSLTNLPQTSLLAVAPTQLSFSSQVNQPAPPGQQVQVTNTGGAVSWTASTSAPWMAANPTAGTTPGTATISVNPAGLSPGNYSGSMVFTSPAGGTTAVLVIYSIAATASLVTTPTALVFSTPGTTTTPPTQTLAVTSTAGTIGYSITTQVATPAGGSWLKASPGSGQTAGNVQVSVDLTGLSKGIYSGSVLLTPTNSSINLVSVPVTLLVACGSGGCTGLPATILSIVNGASLHPGGAPRELMTLFGTNLADNVYQATGYPLPTQLGPTSVTVNGASVPLYYVSPTQINFQMPSNAPATSVQVSVNNGFTLARTSQPHTANLTAVDPGLFTSAGNRAAALNQDFTVHTAATPQPAGAYILLYITGGGPISPVVPDGAAAPSSPLSFLTGDVQVFIGGKPAQVAYAGAAPGFAGTSQINAVIPSGLAPGDQPVFVTVNGVASNVGLITLK